MTKEDAGDDMGRIAINDLIEKICQANESATSETCDCRRRTSWIWKGIAAIPASQDMANHPYSFPFIFSILELVGEELQVSADIRVCCVSVTLSVLDDKEKNNIHVVEKIASVPEVCVEGDDTQFGIFGVIDTISAVVHSSLVGCGLGDPIVLSPKS